LPAYPELRDRPDRIATSRLSRHLHHGEIGPRQVWHAVAATMIASRHRPAGARVAAAAAVFLRQIVWREFAWHLLHHFPHTTDRPLRPAFEKFPWARSRTALRRWQEERTGFPIVDAGMRELQTTGWMHNRVRMVAASFLVKDLRVSWTAGARWFWHTLVEADLAINTLNWQWVAGCGADAAPYFRIFNPAIQGGKFDPRGDYVRRLVPEIAALPDRWIHRPAEAPVEALRRAGVRLGADYPRPMVDHPAARRRALAAFALVSGHDGTTRRRAHAT
jgi:deoxyribodipyrimidine photo-lyase